MNWIRLNTVKEGKGNLIALSFAVFMNDKPLLNICLLPGFRRTISVNTARSWLCELGFEYGPTHSKHGVYKDGHKREDVFAYRKEIIANMRKLEAAHPPPPPPSDGDTPDKEMEKARSVAKEQVRFVRKELVIITHDETTFHLNDDERFA